MINDNKLIELGYQNYLHSVIPGPFIFYDTRTIYSWRNSTSTETVVCIPIKGYITSNTSINLILISELLILQYNTNTVQHSDCNYKCMLAYTCGIYKCIHEAHGQYIQMHKAFQQACTYLYIYSHVCIPENIYYIMCRNKFTLIN